MSCALNYISKFLLFRDNVVRTKLDIYVFTQYEYQLKHAVNIQLNLDEILIFKLNVYPSQILVFAVHQRISRS